MKDPIKIISRILLLMIVLISCDQPVKKQIDKKAVDWQSHEANHIPSTSIIKGTCYLPVYSQVYQLHQHKTYNLTVMVSLRNVSPTDSVYILNADYFDSSGEKIHEYLKNPIFLRPLETVEIVIDENDDTGGTGGNFIFDWVARNKMQIPLFEAIMISTTGQQGLSFTTRSVQIKD